MNNCQHLLVKSGACLLVTASLLSGESAFAADYLVDDEVSCLALAASLGGTTTWQAGAPVSTCIVVGGTLAAGDTLIFEDVRFRPQTDPLTNLGEITVDVSAFFYGAALFVNRGTINILGGGPPVPENLSSIENYGTFNAAVDFYNSGSFTNFCGGAITGNVLNVPVIQETGCAPSAAAIPSMSAWSLGVLVSLLGFVGLRRFNKSQ